MPRNNRCVLPGLPYHVTQRGVDHRETFSGDGDRFTYVRMLRENREDAGVTLLAWCIMTNHVHLVAIPEREDSLAVYLRRVHGRYAQYYNARTGRTGHLWQNRFFACPVSGGHLWRALAYVEQNPLRAGLAPRAEEYRWSSAAAHVWGRDEALLLDLAWWRREGPGAEWAWVLNSAAVECREELQRCTYSGRPFGDEAFVEELSRRFGRYWQRGRPRKKGKKTQPDLEPSLFS